MSLKILSKDELQPKIGVVVGTRPGIIKFSPVIRELAARDADFFIIHTGQHYSHNMDRAFFEDLELRLPKHVNPDVKNCKLHGEQTAEMIKGVEKACLQEKPQVVIVGGDANTNLAAGLAVRKLGLCLVHMEAGLRSDDWSMPEEHNRVMLDHISDILLPPTINARRNLERDYVKGRIVMTGNPIVDAVKQNIKLANEKSSVLEDNRLEDGKYFLLTFHREENVDVASRMEEFARSMRAVAERYDLPCVFPVHPRTKLRLEHFGVDKVLRDIPTMRLIEPVGYLDFLKLMGSARLVLTDSGGIQEESCISGVPCVTLRENTERPETVDIGANILAGTNHQRILAAMAHFLENKDVPVWKQPFGDDPAAKIVDVLMDEISA